MLPGKQCVSVVSGVQDDVYKILNRFLKMCCRIMEQRTLKGRVESVAKLKGLDIGTTKQGYTI